MNNKNIFCELCALARDPVDAVNLANIVLSFGAALTSRVSPARLLQIRKNWSAKDAKNANIFVCEYLSSRYLRFLRTLLFCFGQSVIRG